MPGNPLTDPDWAPKLADTVVRLVGGVRDKTTAKVLTAYRGIVFGLVGAFGGLLALVLLIVALVRALQALLDVGFDHHNSVWMSYLLIGTIFTTAGLVAMKKRFPTVHDDVPV